MWITALTARYLRLARDFVDIDDAVLEKALNWLMRTQEANGAFAETGRRFNERIQSDDTAMTSFVVLAFLDNAHGLSTLQRNAMNRGISYIAESWRDAESPYPLSLATYVLHRAEHPHQDGSYQLLESKATTITKGDLVSKTINYLGKRRLRLKINPNQYLINHFRLIFFN